MSEFNFESEVQSYLKDQAREEADRIRSEAAQAVNACLARNGFPICVSECEALPPKVDSYLDQHTYDRSRKALMGRVLGGSSGYDPETGMVRVEVRRGKFTAAPEGSEALECILDDAIAKMLRKWGLQRRGVTRG